MRYLTKNCWKILLAKLSKHLKTGKPATVAAKEFAKEMGTQAGLGAAGEAVGSLAIGEVPNPAAVIGGRLRVN
jgi:hypothetical protein